MKRRFKAGSVKPRRRNATTPKRASGTARSSSAAGAESEIARLAHDLNDALERETAASEVLKIISSAQAASVQPVLDTVVSNAARLCRALNATIYLREDDSVVIHAQHGPPGLSPVGTRRPINRDWVTGAAILDARPIQVADLLNSKDYPAGRELARRLGHRTTLAVPLLRDKTAVGVIVATRREVHPFSRTQIALLQNFAAQAVIAIENTRLLSELRQSLEQQTATSEVLGVISRSPGELEPVFESILANATRLCEANFGILHLYENGKFRTAARHKSPPAFAQDVAKRPLQPGPLHPLVRMAATKQLLHISDYAEDPAYKQHDPMAVRLVELANARTLIEVPMLKEGELIGAIAIYRQEVRPFNDKQIALVQNFAAQAVIAIENARLLNELRQRTDDLTESLEQQTAAADVLRIISTSPGDLAPVFDSMLRNATKLCDAKFGNLFLRNGDGFRSVAMYSMPSIYARSYEQEPFISLARLHPHAPLAQIAETRDIVHISDLMLERSYLERDPRIVALVETAGARTDLLVPMQKDDKIVGAFAIYRQEVRLFTDKQIELVKNFANQAVIAIESARLLKELRERTDQLANLNQQLETRVADQVGEIERMGRLRRFLPPQVADLIVASGTEKQLESHRREITALFCDLRGFTGFSKVQTRKTLWRSWPSIMRP
jgi:GAF domain-containing protein